MRHRCPPMFAPSTALAVAVLLTATACRPAKSFVVDFRAANRGLLFTSGQIDWRDYEPVCEATVHFVGSRLYLPYVRNAVIPPIARANEIGPYFYRFDELARALGGDAFIATSIKRYRPTYAGFPIGAFFVGWAASGNDGRLDMQGTVVKLKK